MKQKKISQSFLDSLKGKKPAEVRESIFKLGFDTREIAEGQAVFLLLIEDLVDLHLDSKGFISKAKTCDKDQTK